MIVKLLAVKLGRPCAYYYALLAESVHHIVVFRAGRHYSHPHQVLVVSHLFSVSLLPLCATASRLKLYCVKLLDQVLRPCT